ncbi:prolyl oligopeptidase family serine peptidase [Mucisphaera sp.]|uniref:carboxylesterase family protein n=1 Tax=Mucisphaera sp. TaxID=2913024 RepID=UPI003D09FC10
MTRSLTLIALTLLLTTTLLTADHHQPTNAKQSPARLETTIQKDLSLNYLIALPTGYHASPDQTWPLILFLHGAGERGDDLNKVKAWGPPKKIEEGMPIPAIVVSPQCPQDSWWPDEVDALHALLDQIEQTHNVDPDRIIVTGLSMGGFGTWSLVGSEPDRFAAAAPICGGATWNDARTIGQHQVPLWNFHGEADNVVPIDESLRAMKRVRAAGHTTAKLTIYPNGNHGAWIPAYNDPELWTWMLNQNRADRLAEETSNE